MKPYSIGTIPTYPQNIEYKSPQVEKNRFLGRFFAKNKIIFHS